jgi:hypothetical protein
VDVEYPIPKLIVKIYVPPHHKPGNIPKQPWKWLTKFHIDRTGMAMISAPFHRIILKLKEDVTVDHIFKL